MRVLDAGTEPLSNADVLQWIRAKREQHKQEDDADKKAGLKPTKRPSNFLKALEKHERELSSKHYPYERNPAAYTGYDSMRKLDGLIIDRIIVPLSNQCACTSKSKEELDKTLSKLHEAKSLTETELLMIHNHAPKVVEMLQPMIENVEERFTDEEQAIIVECIKEVYRYNEVDTAGGEENAQA